MITGIAIHPNQIFEPEYLIRISDKGPNNTTMASETMAFELTLQLSHSIINKNSGTEKANIIATIWLALISLIADISIRLLIT